MAAFSFSSPLTWEGSHASLAPSRGAACMECPAEVHCQFSEPFAGGHGPSHTGHTSLGGISSPLLCQARRAFLYLPPGVLFHDGPKNQAKFDLLSLVGWGMWDAAPDGCREELPGKLSGGLQVFSLPPFYWTGDRVHATGIY